VTSDMSASVCFHTVFPVEVKYGGGVGWGEAEVWWGEAEVWWGEAEVWWGEAEVRWGCGGMKWSVVG